MAKIHEYQEYSFPDDKLFPIPGINTFSFYKDQSSSAFKSFCGESGAEWETEIDYKKLNDRIEIKNDKKLNYEKCLDEYWLLIVYNMHGFDFIHANTINLISKHPWDRMILFDYMQKKCIEI